MKNNKLEKVSSLKRLMLKISPNLFWKNIEEIGEFSFSEINIDSLIIPDNVKEIGISAFARNKYIKKITLSNNISELPYKCFWLCSNLKEINFPKSLKTIHESCFTECGFESIFIPKNVEKIWDSAFSFNNNLEKIELESAGTYIHYTAFGFCNNIKTIKIGNNVFNVSKKQKIVKFFTDDKFNQIAILKNENQKYSLVFIDENQSVVVPIFEEKLIEKLFGLGAGHFDYSAIKNWQITKSSSPSKTVQKTSLPESAVMFALGYDEEMINAFYKTKANGFDHLKNSTLYKNFYRHEFLIKLYATLGGFEENASHQKRALEVLELSAYRIPNIEIPVGISHTRTFVTEYAHDKNNKPIFKDGLPVEKGTKVVKYHKQICTFIEKYVDHDNFNYVIQDVLTRYPEIHRHYKKQLANLNPERNPNGDLEKYNNLKARGIDIDFVLDFSRRYSYNYKNEELGDALVNINWRLSQKAVTQYDKLLTLAKSITQKAITQNKDIKVFSNNVIDTSNNSLTYFWPPITSPVALTIGERFGTCFTIDGRNEAAIEYIVSNKQDALILIMKNGEPIAYCRVNYDINNKGILIDNIELDRQISFTASEKIEIWNTCVSALKDMQTAMNKDGKYIVERISCKPDPYNKVFAEIKDLYPKVSEIKAKNLTERRYNSRRGINYPSYYASYDKKLEQIVISSPEMDNQKEI